MTRVDPRAPRLPRRRRGAAGRRGRAAQRRRGLPRARPSAARCGVPVRVDGRGRRTPPSSAPVGRARDAPGGRGYFANGGQVAWVVRIGRDGAPAAAAPSWARSTRRRLDGPARRGRLPGHAPARARRPARGVGQRHHRARHATARSGFAGRAGARRARRGARRAGRCRAGLAAGRAARRPSPRPGWSTAAFVGGRRRGAAGGRGPARRAHWTLRSPAAPSPVVDAARAYRDGGRRAGPGRGDRAGLRARTSSDARADRAATTWSRRSPSARCAAGQDRLVVVVAAAAADAATLGRLDASAQRVAIADPRRSARSPRTRRGCWPRTSRATAPTATAATDPVGHVCGVIARLDRERGSGWSPANALVSDAIDVAEPAAADRRPLAHGQRRQPAALPRRRRAGDLGRAHARPRRRPAHRAPPAGAPDRARDPPGRRAAGLRHRRPAAVVHASRAPSAACCWRRSAAARCRARRPTRPTGCAATRPRTRPRRIDAGQVVCEIEIAPAAPMEFITLRLTLGAAGPARGGGAVSHRSPTTRGPAARATASSSRSTRPTPTCRSRRRRSSR